jgi:hypothetical protein
MGPVKLARPLLFLALMALPVPRAEASLARASAPELVSAAASLPVGGTGIRGTGVRSIIGSILRP